MIDHDIQIMPGQFWEELNEFNEDLFESKLTLNYNEDKKHIMIEMKDEESGQLDFQVKAKFFALNEQPEEYSSESQSPRLRLRLVKKRGDIQKWYDVLNEMLSLGFNEILLAPLSHQNEKLTIEDYDESTKSEWIPLRIFIVYD